MYFSSLFILDKWFNETYELWFMINSETMVQTLGTNVGWSGGSGFAP